MTKGRKRVPTKLHILHGNPGGKDIKHRQEVEPVFNNGKLSCPDYLDPLARQEFNRLRPQLIANGLLDEANIALFINYCIQYSEFVRLTEQVNELESYTISSANGGIRAHPLVKMRNDAATLMKQSMVEFGFTPASASKVEAKPTDGNSKEEFNC